MGRWTAYKAEYFFTHVSEGFIIYTSSIPYSEAFQSLRGQATPMKSRRCRLDGHDVIPS